MDLFIYFPPGMSMPRDEIEDALQECMGERGEVTGGGAGVKGSNLDLLIFENDKSIVDDLKSTLRGLEVPYDTVLVLNGEESTLGLK